MPLSLWFWLAPHMHSPCLVVHTLHTHLQGAWPYLPQNVESSQLKLSVPGLSQQGGSEQRLCSHRIHCHGHFGDLQDFVPVWDLKFCRQQLCLALPSGHSSAALHQTGQIITSGWLYTRPRAGGDLCGTLPQKCSAW